MSFFTDAAKIIGENGDEVGRKKGGEIIVRREFFYTHGYTSKKLADAIFAKLKAGGLNVMCTGHDEVWKPFRGGASVAQSSHWWATFKLVES